MSHKWENKHIELLHLYLTGKELSKNQALTIIKGLPSVEKSSTGKPFFYVVDAHDIYLYFHERYPKRFEKANINNYLELEGRAYEYSYKLYD